MVPKWPAAPIRVLYFSSLSDLGNGGQESLLQLVTRLDREEVQPVVVVPAEGTLAERLREESIPVEVLDLPGIAPLKIVRLLKTLRRLTTLLDRRGVDVLHTDGPRNTFYAGIAGRLKRRPVVWHVRNSRRDPLDPLLYLLPSKVVLVAGALRRRFSFWGRAGKCVTIYNGIDPNNFNPGCCGDSRRDELCFQEGDLLVLAAGRIEEAKGQLFLVEACGVLRTKYPNLRIVFVGRIEDPRYFSRCRQRATELGVLDNVSFLGAVRDIRRVLSLADMFVLPSVSGDAFSRAILEAMAMGKPVIATDVGGAREAVDPLCGFVVPPGSGEDLAHKISWLADHAELRVQMGRAARERALRDFDIRENVRRTRGVYRALTGGH